MGAPWAKSRAMVVHQRDMAREESGGGEVDVPVARKRDGKERSAYLLSDSNDWKKVFWMVGVLGTMIGKDCSKYYGRACY
eukprot:747721-Hanusia_phi.AAC.1